MQDAQDTSCGTPRLSTSTLDGARAALPAYDRSALTVGIVHIGMGGFHRAHQAMVVDDLLAAGATDWAICGLGVLPGDTRMRDALVEQDGLYTLMVKHPDGRRELRVIGSVVDMVHAPDDPDAAVERMADPGVRIVSLTITEGGYNFSQSTGLFDPTEPKVARDVERLRRGEGSRLESVFGLVLEALRRRRERGVPPFTVMSCDNIQGNGEVAARQMGAFARLVDGGLADWVAEHVPFPSSMVDRITPVTSDEDRAEVAQLTGREDAWPVVCEPFWQWALEDHFVSAETAAGRPPFEDAGVQVVPDVEPYELMKLRLLNASHQALCYPGRLDGLTYAHEVCTDPLFVEYLLTYMEREATPTLPPVEGVDLADYRRTLVERFANPEVRDTLARLCAESSDRIPQWLMPVVRENLAAGRPVDLCAAIVASWARYAEGVDEQGRELEVVDQRRDRVMAAAAQQGSDPLAFLRDQDLFGDVVEQEAFTQPYLAALEDFRGRSARDAVRAVLDRAASADR